LKHCTTATTKKSPRIKMGLKTKRRALFKNRISAAQKEEGKKKMPKKDPILKRGRERVRT